MLHLPTIRPIRRSASWEEGSLAGLRRNSSARDRAADSSLGELEKGAGMKTLGACAIIATSVLSASTLFGGDIDGVNLLVTKEPPQGSVRLDWTGGQPYFGVFRSVNPAGVVSPGNRLGLTASSTWPDVPPAGSIFFYKIVSAACTPV